MTKIVFPKYMPDGPSYSNSVTLEIHHCTAVLKTDQRGAGPARRLRVVLSPAVAAIARVESLSEERKDVLWAAMDDGDRHYYEKPGNIDDERGRWLVMEDGSQGAVLLGGESNFVSFFVLPTGGPAQTQMVDFETDGEAVQEGGEVLGDSDSRMADDVIDELALNCEAWTKNRARGITPAIVRGNILHLALEALQVEHGCAKAKPTAGFPSEFVSLMSQALGPQPSVAAESKRHGA